MARRKIVAGNWKMHGAREEIARLLDALLEGYKTITAAELVVFPPAVYLSQVAEHLAGSNIAWGAQNVSAYEPGAHTGEIAVSMLQEFGCRYVLVGHSERRILYAEDSNSVARKFLQAKQHQLTPILCVGETRAQREAGQTDNVIRQQLAAVLELDEGVALLADAVVAYEPVWAIGTGMTATPEQAQQVHEMVRQQVSQLDDSIAQALPILYGGSVKPDNAEQLFSCPDIDGGLVGGASLNAADFLAIATR